MYRIIGLNSTRWQRLVTWPVAPPKLQSSLRPGVTTAVSCYSQVTSTCHGGGTAFASVQLLAAITITGLLTGSALGENLDPPVVIPQPQAVHRASDQRLVLGEAGAIVSQTVAGEEGPLFEEAVALVERTLRSRRLGAGSRPPVTTIVLTTKTALEAGSAMGHPPALDGKESAALARSDQAYVIRMRPGIGTALVKPNSGYEPV